MPETSFVAGWMITVPLLLVALLCLWALISPDYQDVHECRCEGDEPRDPCPVHDGLYLITEVEDDE